MNRIINVLVCIIIKYSIQLQIKKSISCIFSHIPLSLKLFEKSIKLNIFNRTHNKFMIGSINVYQFYWRLIRRILSPQRRLISSTCQSTKIFLLFFLQIVYSPLLYNCVFLNRFQNWHQNFLVLLNQADKRLSSFVIIYISFGVDLQRSSFLLTNTTHSLKWKSIFLN